MSSCLRRENTNAATRSYALASLMLAAWPVTEAEKKGEAYVYDARVVGSSACTTKQPIELRLYVKGSELRLGLKNCGGKPVKVLHDANLGPSSLELTPAAKSTFDDRSMAKFDPTVKPEYFTTVGAGEERIVGDAKAQPGGELKWGPFQYSGVAPKAKVKVVLAAKGLAGVDAVTGRFVSNEVTLP
ncbi:MAG: hypothetical protein JNK82_42475 [Myxococcaceae bacterium]|nr:hypothetical protein [Myxococcaceae bacterium]